MFLFLFLFCKVFDGVLNGVFMGFYCGFVGYCYLKLFVYRSKFYLIS